MRLIIMMLVVCLIHACSKWFAYYCGTTALLYYLADKYDDLLSEAKLREITNAAVERNIKDFFRVKK